MKKFLLAASLLMALSIQGQAQVDDIYDNGSSQRTAESRDSRTQNSNQQNNNTPTNQSVGTDNQYNTQGNVNNSYDNPDDYIDYDDYSYSARINRFNYGFYNMGYYSMFYNPFWYNPYWYDPYWGYNPWRNNVGVSFGFGWGGPSIWGYNTWLGYPAWSTCWGYSSFGCGWGGGFYGGCYGGYYGGAWASRVYRSNSDFRPYRSGSSAYGPRQVGGVGFGANGRGSGSGLKTMPTQVGGTRPYAFNSPVQVNGNGGVRSNAIQNNGIQQTDRPRGLSRIFGGGNNPRGNADNGQGSRPTRSFFSPNTATSPNRGNGNDSRPSRSTFGGVGNTVRSFGGAVRDMGRQAAPAQNNGGGGRSFGGNSGGGGGRSGGSAPAPARSSGGSVGRRR